ncbi:MAG: membrane-bound O-acyltransferase family protein [Bacteroidetes bacterium HGW-Bacteroidetes-19]|nr:MAG: membrane-bound O-acyltransferase family protein [Bacteroidetes bacterium HGW-Bacteroidetes-20]PKP27617.1 MAG: membrane-bound O-acyltransferase family protein [Bacteroidetes bacterium HGW-Bacteroidetes-19]
MLFNSYEFALFLPIVFVLYWFVFQKNLKLQNLFILAVSYLFYGWWDWKFLILIALTSVCSWGSGVLVQHFDKEENSKFNKRKWITAANLILNLGILGFFKYYNFFITNFIELFSSMGITLEATTLKVILPVGISFYTFQALSYTIDVYRRDIVATKDVVSFLAYVSFFPQLVAGPIERATNLLPQFFKPRKFDYSQAIDGGRQILWGLFKKIVIADNCAIVANYIFGNSEQMPGSALVIGVICFAFQIYGDFSGYSDIAIGVGRLFGIKLMRNFHFPYFSRDIAEFWRRWHISLNTWFRDYLYFPLGGSRNGKWIAIRNTMIIFLVSGLWHGANWTFIIWGAFHALLFLPLLLMGKNRKHTNIVAQNSFLPTFKEFSQILLTFTLVSISWVLFRADNIHHAFNYFDGIFNVTLFKSPLYVSIINNNIGKLVVILPILIIVEWVQRKREHGLEIMGLVKYQWIRILIYYTIIFFIAFLGAKQAQFIYFQF